MRALMPAHGLDVLTENAVAALQQLIEHDLRWVLGQCPSSAVGAATRLDDRCHADDETAADHPPANFASSLACERMP